MRERTRIAILALGLGWALAAARAEATNIVSFEAPSGAVGAGDTLEVTLRFDFSDSTVGGGFDLVFSPALLRFESFAFSDDLGRDPAFDLAPSPGATTDPLVIAFGNFDELSGQRTIGSARFEALADLVVGGVGPALVTGRDNTSPAGPFFGDGPSQLAVEYQALSGLPEPAALPLLAAGLLVLAAARSSSG